MFFDPYFDILMNLAGSMRSHRKVYQFFFLILKIFGKENLYDGFDVLSP